MFTSEGITVKEERKAPLSNDTKYVTIDELEWDDFPIENLTMEVTNIWPQLSDEDDTALEALEFEVERLERSDAQTEASTSDDFWEQVYEQTGITYEDGEITLSGNKNAKDNLVAFVDFLLVNGYLTEGDLPIKSGWKRYLINTEPLHQKGGSMAEDVEVTDGVYLETKYSRKDICKKIKELAERVGELE
ncbi:type I restriction endonuclease subunit R [Natronobacterium lacisalsi]|uniref:type I restriction endonuclease subunit R n=1 Tax=Natronobacterium lacisalsi TaxID=229731 RepID=UPI000AB12FF5|nr:type I restriction endonuclease subunit R [Halobiforma lacisalsi]